MRKKHVRSQLGGPDDTHGAQQQTRLYCPPVITITSFLSGPE